MHTMPKIQCPQLNSTTPAAKSVKALISIMHVLYPELPGYATFYLLNETFVYQNIVLTQSINYEQRQDWCAVVISEI